MTTATAPLPPIMIPAGITLRGRYSPKETALCRLRGHQVVWDWCEFPLDANDELLVVCDHSEQDLRETADEIVIALHTLGYPNAHTVIEGE